METSWSDARGSIRTAINYADTGDKVYVADGINVYKYSSPSMYNCTIYNNFAGCSGGAKTPVTAVPNMGNFFVNWSDGLTTAARKDSNITTDTSFTVNITPGAAVAIPERI